MSKRPKPTMLVILDGWGHREEKADNAIASANTPFFNRVIKEYPHGLINASELHVGLPSGQMGNSEVGHMNIGSGRVLMQDLPRIDKAIEDGSLFKNKQLLAFIENLKKTKASCHLMGLLSPGGVHSHQNHMASLASFIGNQGVPVHVHAFLDGRDTPPQSALEYLETFEQEKRRTHSPSAGPLGEVVMSTVSGRYYAMDRDKRWDRVQKAYDALTKADGPRVKDMTEKNGYTSARKAIEESYAAGVTDEFVLPTVLDNYSGMNDGDGILCVNFRADRVREILTALLDPSFKEFPRAKLVKFSSALGLTEYSEKLNPFIGTLFPPQPLSHILGELVSEAGMKQLRIAETEKYAHVTFFFNGGREKEFPGEERILVPSPKVATYDLQPEMSAGKVTEELLAAINADRFDFIVVNYANTDMVGHTGDLQAAVKAVETVDSCLAQLEKAVTARGGAMLITADHGNAEMMHDPDSGQPHTAHTLNLVPAIIIAPQLKGKAIQLPEGKLGDVAPTLLALMGLKQPAEMTGRSLLAAHAG